MYIYKWDWSILEPYPWGSCTGSYTRGVTKVSFIGAWSDSLALFSCLCSASSCHACLHCIACHFIHYVHCMLPPYIAILGLWLYIGIIGSAFGVFTSLYLHQIVCRIYIFCYFPPFSSGGILPLLSIYSTLFCLGPTPSSCKGLCSFLCLLNGFIVCMFCVLIKLYCDFLH